MMIKIFLNISDIFSLQLHQIITQADFALQYDAFECMSSGNFEIKDNQLTDA